MNSVATTPPVKSLTHPTAGAPVDTNDFSTQHQAWSCTDPAGNFSDWTIQVKRHESGDIIDYYHVHRIFLARGLRASTFFSQLFDGSQSFCENKEATCNFEWDAFVANAFPDLLDYLYSGNCQIVTSNATALYFLANYLMVPSLTDKLKKFMDQDLALKNLDIYCLHAKTTCQEEVLCRVESVFIDNIMEINASSAILQVIEPDMFVSALTSAKITRSITLDLHVCKVIVAYCQMHTDLTPALIYTLMLEECLRAIDFQLSTELYEIAEKYAIDTLKTRCVDCIIRHSDKVNLCDSNDKIRGFLQRQPGNVVVKIMNDIQARQNSKLRREQCNREKKLIRQHQLDIAALDSVSKQHAKDIQEKVEALEKEKAVAECLRIKLRRSSRKHVQPTTHKPLIIDQTGIVGGASS